MTTVRAALADGAGRLSAAGIDDAATEAGWILAHVLGSSAGALRLQGDQPLRQSHANAFAGLIDRRAMREPIQYLLGTQEFMGLSLAVTPAVLIPRLDTETLVTAAVEHLSGSPLVADIGTGSGAIAIALAVHLPRASLVATDISEAALAVARGNADRHGVAGRIAFRQGDLLAPLEGAAYDAILVNPPYIDEAEWRELEPDVRDWEPRGALTPGPDGLEPYRRLAFGAPPLLKPGGFLAVEVGHRQAAAVSALFAAAGLQVTLFGDTAGIERVVMGRLAS